MAVKAATMASSGGYAAWEQAHETPTPSTHCVPRSGTALCSTRGQPGMSRPGKRDLRDCSLPNLNHMLHPLVRRLRHNFSFWVSYYCSVVSLPRLCKVAFNCVLAFASWRAELPPTLLALISFTVRGSTQVYLILFVSPRLSSLSVVYHDQRCRIRHLVFPSIFSTAFSPATILEFTSPSSAL